MMASLCQVVTLASLRVSGQYPPDKSHESSLWWDNEWTHYCIGKFLHRNLFLQIWTMFWMILLKWSISSSLAISPEYFYQCVKILVVFTKPFFFIPRIDSYLKVTPLLICLNLNMKFKCSLKTTLFNSSKFNDYEWLQKLAYLSDIFFEIKPSKFDSSKQHSNNISSYW